MSEKYALIIANTEYTDPGLSKLEAPGKDAKELERVLFSPEICAFNDVSVLFNEVASKVKETIEHFLSDRKPNDLLVLYFSGHGVRDENGSLYLAVKNTNRSRLRSTAIEADFIRDIMDQSRSKRQVLILDCCNSGAFAKGTKAELGGSIGTAAAFEGKGYGRVVLTASDSTQFAWEGDTLVQGGMENSLFTNYLVKGLEGEADTDGDGRVTIDELYDYAYEHIVNITPKQTPGKWSYKQQGEIILREKIRIEDTRPVPLPEDLVEAISSSLPYVREGAVKQLELLLKGKNLSLSRSARLALEKMAAEDDSKYVAQAAARALASVQTEQKETQKPSTVQPVPSLEVVPTPPPVKEQEKIPPNIEEIKIEPAQLVPEPQDDRQIDRGSLAPALEVKKVEAQLPASKFPIKWFGIGVVAIAIMAVVLIALRPSGSGSPPPSDTPPATIAPTEAIAAATESIQQVPVPILDTPTPTVQPTVPTPTTEETATSGPVTPLPEITDEHRVPMVLVPAGEFMMGDNRGDTDERPLHPVELDAYYIDKYEVTNASYKACERGGACKQPYQLRSATRNPYYPDAKYNNYPVIYVDWNMAKAYCEWRGAQLPTEAQWEKAARGTDQRTYPWGEDLSCQKANYHGRGGCPVDTSEVGIYADGKSLYGAHDMAGNVFEWVADWYSGNYYDTQLFFSNPTGPETGRARVQRGGSFAVGIDKLNSSNRFPYAPTDNRHDLGFRCAKPVLP